MCIEQNEIYSVRNIDIIKSPLKDFKVITIFFLLQCRNNASVTLNPSLACDIINDKTMLVF